MITLEELRTKYKPQILELAAKHGVTDIRVFGSVARGEAREDSDIDFLIKRLPKTDLMDICSHSCNGFAAYRSACTYIK